MTWTGIRPDGTSVEAATEAELWTVARDYVLDGPSDAPEVVSRLQELQETPEAAELRWAAARPDELRDEAERLIRAGSWATLAKLATTMLDGGK